MSSTDDSSSTPCSIPDYKPSGSDEDNSLVLNLPGMNSPEKIVFVIDTVRERNCTPFKFSTGDNFMPLFMIKRIIENFICAKSIIQRSHEYALMTLNSHSAQWICDFTNNNNSIVNYLNLVNEDILEEDQTSYDLGQMFDKIREKLPLPAKKDDTIIPTFVVRVILMYSRSNSIPKFHTAKYSLDILTKKIATLNTANLSYILEVGRNAIKLHDNMAKLLAHPLQRPPQKDVCYAICPIFGFIETNNSV
ncbi:BRISC and BRCA1-A complex member 1 [Habropoda laboriosa]|uniref:BRISC and BRCA1-A complex member 1 n=1 Tax=Habropoda laboriosa TaxID=597456 RepID=A0A0L7RDM9_9HYME|nr:BRISC and BRCA1-A complex member 1 [Habropoda laboriosa]